ncbi:hypothetical protein KKF63_05825, partial [bacterium]|nr:hypothetical protein [bacterium]
RYYNPKLARFIQADTVVPNPTNLQDYNRYSYAANNPLKYIDPSGHEYEAPGDNDSDFYFEDDNGDPMDYSFDQDIGSFDDYDVGGGDQSYSDPDNSTVSAIPADSIYTGTIFDYESWEPYASLDVEDYVSDANFLKIVVGITNIVRGVMSLCKAASTVIITAVAIYSGVGIPFSPLVLAVGAYQLFIAFPGLTKRGFQQLREGLGVNAREMKLGYAVNLKGLLPFGQDLDDPTEGVGHALDKKKDLLNSIGNKAFVEPWNAAKEFYEKIILDFSM